MCPAPPHHTPRSATAIAADDHLIHIDSDGAVVSEEGRTLLNGRVIVRQDDRSVTADTVSYDRGSARITVSGAVDFEDPLVRVKSDSGSYDQTEGADFAHADFELLDRPGRGSAGEIAVRPAGKIALDQVRYTTCPVGDQDWMLEASSITLDTARHEGTARGAWMEFKGVPILYTPYFSFPLGSERKSGVLVPILDHSGSNGFEIGLPYYFDLAPNYDMTLTPEYLSARGVELGGEFRFLTSKSHGQLEAVYLPHDMQTDTERSYVHVTDVTDFKRGLRGEVDIAAVSDSSYFENFGVGSEQTSVTFLERRADLRYYDDYWRVSGELQNFQTLDVTHVGAADRPYSRVPRLDAQGLFPLGATRFEFAIDAEAVNFLRSIGPSGVRMDISPEFRWSDRAAGYFFEPAVGWHLTQYSREDATAGTQSAPFRSVPYARLDTGLIFERNAGSQGRRSETLEPRAVYSYVPYRNQTTLPVFDSALPDLNLSELFRTNRYVGEDRIGDADQLSLGLTTRLFEQDTGQQYLAATLGQIRYFSGPHVTLPCQNVNAATAAAVRAAANAAGVAGANAAELLAVNPAALFAGAPASMFVPNGLGVSGANNAAATAGGLPVTCQPAITSNASDLVGDVALTAYRDWTLNLDYVWSPHVDRTQNYQTEKSEVSLQYRPDPSRVVNLGYRFQHDTFEQWDASFAWPIADHWNAVGRLVYSIMDRQAIEQVAGFEYRSCCWRIQVVQRRYVDNQFGNLNESIALQFELIGLGSVGKAANTFLERSISGYSASDHAP
jgi:LPS-assembly protein